ncbi:MAG: exodeoxyribonuclease VII large subunit [Sulfurovum sp. AS07-7]|nr:MAG: exodeoxyribonuclease VII large subunit [Sulfurovum sp. AS07-7]
MANAMMSVSSLNTKIKSLLEATFIDVALEGEVSSLTYHSSGHIYLSLKDSNSSIKAVMFKGNASKLKFKLTIGLHIVLYGSVSVYTPRGEYQLYVNKIEPFGEGALSLAFEQLKMKLASKGYFELSHKKPKPKVIKKLALVTSINGAALADMLKIIEKRWSLIEVVIIDTLVQGDSSALSIATALRYADGLEVDAIIVGRGGGSREDLWAFNEEIVADAIYEAKTFIMSAVGHEIDFLISDFVADMRAPTPSGAIEMLLPDKQELLILLNELQERYKKNINLKLNAKLKEVEDLKAQTQRFNLINRLEYYQKEFETLYKNLNKNINLKINNISFEPIKIAQKLHTHINYSLNHKHRELLYIIDNFELNNPKNAHKEGFVELLKASQRVTLSQIKIGDRVILTDITAQKEFICLR